MRIVFALWLITMACSAPAADGARAEDTAGRRDSVAAVAAATMAQGGESRVLGLLALTHAADSALGALGAQRGSTLEIKDFGRMIFREHNALRRDALRLGEELGVTPDVSAALLDEPPSVMRETLLSRETGAAWDRAYVDYAIAVHEAAIENTARALAATRNDAVKDYIEKTVPILEKHLEKARSLKKKLGAAAS